MRQIKILGLMLLAVVAISAVAATAAFALPSLKTEGGGEEAAFTSNGGGVTELTELGTNLKVSCGNQESTATVKGSLGTFHIDFKECKAQLGGTNLGTCTGLGDLTSGLILVLGEVHLVRDSLVPVKYALLFLLPAGGVHFECKVITTRLFVVTGQVLCLLPNPGLSTTHELDCLATSAGDQEDTRYWSDTEEVTGVHLSTAENEGTAVDSAQAGLVTLVSSIATEIVG